MVSFTHVDIHQVYLNLQQQIKANWNKSAAFSAGASSSSAKSCSSIILRIKIKPNSSPMQSVEQLVGWVFPSGGFVGHSVCFLVLTCFLHKIFTKLVIFYFFHVAIYDGECNDFIFCLKTLLVIRNSPNYSLCTHCSILFFLKKKSFYCYLYYYDDCPHKCFPCSVALHSFVLYVNPR